VYAAVVAVATNCMPLTLVAVCEEGIVASNLLKGNHLNQTIKEYKCRLHSSTFSISWITGKGSKRARIKI